MIILGKWDWQLSGSHRDQEYMRTLSKEIMCWLHNNRTISHKCSISHYHSLASNPAHTLELHAFFPGSWILLVYMVSVACSVCHSNAAGTLFACWLLWYPLLSSTTVWLSFHGIVWRWGDVIKTPLPSKCGKFFGHKLVVWYPDICRAISSKNSLESFADCVCGSLVEVFHFNVMVTDYQ